MAAARKSFTFDRLTGPAVNGILLSIFRFDSLKLSQPKQKTI
jgi:hypothetical protein